MWCLTWWEAFPKRCPLPAARRPLLVSWPPALLQRRGLSFLTCTGRTFTFCVFFGKVFILSFV